MSGMAWLACAAALGWGLALIGWTWAFASDRFCTNAHEGWQRAIEHADLATDGWGEALELVREVLNGPVKP